MNDEKKKGKQKPGRLPAGGRNAENRHGGSKRSG